MKFLMLLLTNVLNFLVVVLCFNLAGILFLDKETNLLDFNIDINDWNFIPLICCLIFLILSNVFTRFTLRKENINMPSIFEKLFFKKSKKQNSNSSQSVSNDNNTSNGNNIDDVVDLTSLDDETAELLRLSLENNTPNDIPKTTPSNNIKFLEEDVIDKIPAGFNLRRNGLSLKVNDKNVVYPDVYVNINGEKSKLDICFCYMTTINKVGDWYIKCLNQRTNNKKAIQNSKRLMKCLKDNFSNVIDDDFICCMLYNVQNFEENNINAIANNTLLFIRMKDKLELYLYSFLDKDNKLYSIPHSEGLTYFTNLSHKLGDRNRQLVNYRFEVKLDTATSNELLKCPVCNYSNEYYGVGVTTASGNDIVAIGSFYDKLKDFITINDNATSISLNEVALENSSYNDTQKNIVRKIVEDTNRHLKECKTHFVGNRSGYTNTKNGSENVEFIRYALRYTYGNYDENLKVYKPFKTFDETIQHCIDIKDFLGLNLEISKDKNTETLEEKISREINSDNLKKQFIDFINIRDNQGNQYEKSFHHIACSHCLYQLPIRLFEKNIQNKYINCTIMLVGTPDSGKTVLLTKINYHCSNFIQNQGIDTYYKEKNETAIFKTKTLPASTNNDNILPTNYITTTLNDTNYTLILKDSVGENAKTILRRNYHIVYLIDITKSATEQFQDLIDIIEDLKKVPDSRTYKIYVIFTKSDMINYNFSNIKYNFSEHDYDFSHSQEIRKIFLSNSLEYKSRDDGEKYYNTCCTHILKKIQEDTKLDIPEMNIKNVNIEAIEKNINAMEDKLSDNGELSKEYISDLKKVKNSYDNYSKIYNNEHLKELQSSISNFENSIEKLINNHTGKTMIVSYNVISALEEYTPIWVDSLSDCTSITKKRFNQNISTDENGNNIYENLIEDIKEVMVNCKTNFSSEIYPTI